MWAAQEGAGDECGGAGERPPGAYAASSTASSVDLDDGVASVSTACTPCESNGALLLLGERTGKPGFVSKRQGKRDAGPFATVYSGAEPACTLDGARGALLQMLIS
jgi:hypothetical protein